MNGVISPNAHGTVSESWCHTRANTSTILYTWKIEDFGCHRGDMFSSEFSCSSNQRVNWCLNISNDFIHCDCTYLSLYLKLVSCDTKDINAKFTFSILNDKKEAKNTKRSQGFRVFTIGQRLGFKGFIRHDHLLPLENGLLNDDTLTIQCEVMMISEPMNISSHNEIVLTEGQLLDDLGSILDDEEFSDVTLAVGGREIHAHKAILAARSRVFAAMFRHDMQEKAENRVEISDAQYEPLLDMMFYIYTGRTPGIEATSKDLLVLSDKYQLEHLKTQCESFLGRSITVDNAAELLILSDMNSAEQLKAKVMQYIEANASEVIMTAGFQVLVSENRLIADWIKIKAKRKCSPARTSSKKARHSLN